MKCDGLIMVSVMITIFWDMMMFGLAADYLLLEELAAAIFMLDVFSSLH